MQPLITLVIVDHHHHVLSHYHEVLRKKQRGEKKRKRHTEAADGSCWQLFHWDAHPDLACPSPNIPAVSCFRPNEEYTEVSQVFRNNQEGQENTIDRSQADERVQKPPVSSNDETNTKKKTLYEFLDDSSSGIAEWILPLTLAGDLHTLHWFYPEHEQNPQIPRGTHTLHVGAWAGSSTKATVAVVDSFVDVPSDSTVKVDWLGCPYYEKDKEAVPFNELVLPQRLNLSVEPAIPKEASCFSFDEDYALDVCLDYFCCANPFLLDIPDTTVARYWKKLYDTFLPTADEQRDATLLQHIRQVWKKDYVSSLPDWMVVDTDDTWSLLCRALRSVPAEKQESLIQALTESQRYMDLPHHAAVSSSEPSTVTLTTLPVARALSSFERDLSSIAAASADANRLPLLITVARSSQDGFTPNAIVHDLQEAVLQYLHDAFCSCGRRMTDEQLSNTTVTNNCLVNIVHDY